MENRQQVIRQVAESPPNPPDKQHLSPIILPFEDAEQRKPLDARRTYARAGIGIGRVF
ncbi:hypothetical protein FQN53_003649 [Emmonsiellopsis sp. PD_33]|nr:hypothetical protein FQN53_003649 [Emmonsiellopsis sp. PD_33]